ncbi:mCG148137 [Mus musculus]|nr:mCG148137 [Mus musculus]
MNLGFSGSGKISPSRTERLLGDAGMLLCTGYLLISVPGNLGRVWVLSWSLL